MPMKIPTFLAAVFILLPSPGFAGDPVIAAASPIENKARQVLNQEIAGMMESYAKTEQCFALEASLQADLAKKKAALAAEFKGKIPVAFDDLLWQKGERIGKQHKACFQQYEALGRLFEALENSFRTIEPKSLNVKKQKETVDAQNEKFLLMVPTAKPHNKSAKPRQGGQ